MKIFVKRILSVLILATVTMPFQGKCQGDQDPDTPVPIDGGVSLLVAAGVAYGVKKAHEYKKKKPLPADVY